MNNDMHPVGWMTNLVKIEPFDQPKTPAVSFKNNFLTAFNDLSQIDKEPKFFEDDTQLIGFDNRMGQTFDPGHDIMTPAISEPGDIGDVDPFNVETNGLEFIDPLDPNSLAFIKKPKFEKPVIEEPKPQIFKFVPLDHNPGIVTNENFVIPDAFAIDPIPFIGPYHQRGEIPQPLAPQTE